MAARTAARRFCGGASRPAARARALSTASSGLPSAARITWSTAWSVRSATLRATAASSTAASGPSSSSATSTPRPARSASSASASGRSGLSRRVSTNSTGRAASRRPMCAHSCMLAGSARCTSSATRSTGRPAAAHSTSRSTASNTRSRSSSGEETGGGGWSRPSRVAMSGASRPSSAGQSASSGGAGTPRASCGTSSCQVASGAAPPTSTPAPIAVLAPAFSARRASSATRRVLPIPASPVIRTTRPCPARAAVQAAMSVRSSAARP